MAASRAIISQFMNEGNASAETRTPAVQQLTRIGMLAAWLSLGSFFYYLTHGEILMHGDATAHINIARRVFDSLYPGPLQLGTVWLPLPHLLMIPFIWPNKMWQTGIGGSIPSMIAYVLGVVGIFRLASGLLEVDERTRRAAQLGGFISAFIYAANPNLLYVQATALTEPLFLAFFIWATVYFTRFVRALGGKDEVERRALRKCAYCLAAAELTRYDGWFLAGVLGCLVLTIALWRSRNPFRRRRALRFLLAIAAAPVVWLAYNRAVYGNALEFANGPYSAAAIEARVGAPNPAAHHFWVAASYFLKSAQITMAVGNWGRFWLLMAVAASALLIWRLRRKTAAVVVFALWSPLPFYALSVAYGSVPLHVPMWWPFAIFNQRFGLELLPLFAVSAGTLVAALCSGRLAAHEWKITAATAALVVTSYWFVWAPKPVCWQEAAHNWEMRRGLDTAVQLAIKELPPDAVYLMDIDEHVGIMERLGISLRRVVNNEDHWQWIRPTDPDGTWERALADPSHYVNYVITFDGDLVDKGVNRSKLTLLEVIHASGQPPARIYQTQLPMNQSR